LLLLFCEFCFSIDEVFVKIASVSEFCNFRKRVGNRIQNEQTKRRSFCYFSLMKSKEVNPYFDILIKRKGYDPVYKKSPVLEGEILERLWLEM